MHPEIKDETEAVIDEPVSSRAALLAGWICREAARVAGVPAARVEPDLPLTGLGLDSLAAVELQQSIEEWTGIAPSLADLLAGVSAADLAREILAARPETSETSQPAEMPETPEDHDLPLSHGQRALWFLNRLAPASGAYHIVAAARVRGRVDAAALGHALAALIARHPALRTTFYAVEGEPRQRARSPLAPPSGFTVVDASSADAAEIQALLLGEAYRPFDLENGPLLRVTLLSGVPGGDRLVIAIHHIVADFGSMAVLARELGSLYAGETAGLPRLPATPTRLAAREAARLAGAEGERLWRYWREELAGAPLALDLPTDRPRPAAQSFTGAAERRRLATSAAALTGLARAHGATPFMVLLAVYQTLLHRYTGQEDLLVGVPAAGRDKAELRDVVGYLVNPLVLRGRPAGDQPFSALLAETRRALLAAFAHQGFPFPLLAERLRPERDPSRSPVFQTTLVLHRAEAASQKDLTAFAVGEPGGAIDLGGLQLESLALPEKFAQFDLALRAADLASGLTLSLQYSSALFDAVTARRLLGHFAHLLAALEEDPERRLSDLPMLSEAETWQLAGEGSDTRKDYPLDAGLHEWIAAQARRTPEAVAVVAGERQVGYRELDRRADRLARRLRALGVGPEARVGICAERSVELMVGLLGILKAGAAYVPLDPELPVERLALLVEDALETHGVVLVGPGLPSSAARGWRGALEVLLDESGPEPDDFECESLAGPPLPVDSLAYVIHTSGSTGRPKGVMNSHRGILNRLLWMQDLYPLRAGDAVLQKTPTGFDVSVWELFWPLLFGARVALARPGGHRDPSYLVDLMAEQRVTVAHFVPSLLPAFLAEEGLARLSTLRRVFLSGEALTYELEQRALSRLGVPLYNLYGPTEAAVEVTLWRCRESSTAKPVPIGRPVANTRIYVVDGSGRPVPIGVVGELWIGGVQVARGYQGQPERTAESFVPDPWGAQPGARAYRTGDRVRRRTSGEIEYLGRRDFQVKVRGVRVELGEVEAALLRKSEIEAAAVLAVGEGSSLRLVAFVVPATEPARIRERLRERLPDAMVPARIVALPALPQNANGKLDRRALARLASSALETETGAFEAPRTPVEELLAVLWSELLGEEAGPIGRDSDFFALGGHSLLATRLAARVERTLGVELPLAAIFAAPTLGELAARIAAPAPEGQPLPPIPPIPPIPAARRDRPLPLSFAQERLWFIDSLDPGTAQYNMPAAFRLSGRLDQAALAAAFAELARRHETLRTSFPEFLGSPVQEIAPAVALALPLVDLAGLTRLATDAELARLAREEATRPFALARGPLLRLTVVRTGAGEADTEQHALLVTLHHVIADGWSIEVLESELAALYGAFVAGRPSPLPELPVQYADFALWQRERFDGELLAREVAWWSERLSGAPAELTLPLDRPRPPLPENRGATLAVPLPAGLSAALAGGSRQAGVTPFMVLLAALQALLARYSGEPAVPVGTPIANRLRAELFSLVGFFVNTLVLLGDLAGDLDFGALLARTRSTALAAYAHQELPFEKLVEALAPERRLGRTPLFQVLLALQNTPPTTLSLAGLEISRLAVETGTAKLDLSLVFEAGFAGLAGTIEYDAELFDRTTIARLAGHLTRLLGAALEEPARRLSELPLLGLPERAQLLGEWHGAVPVARAWVPLHERVDGWARRTPNATAVEQAGRRLTYGELVERANRLAAQLRALGVGPEVPVALLVPRSPEMVIGLLAGWKAGGVLAPLDPGSPPERLALLLADIRPQVILTQEHLLDRLPAGLDAEILLLEGLRPEIPATAPEAGKTAETLPGQLAYILYTSGSTGRPKGVELEQGPLTNFIDWHHRAVALQPEDRVSFLSGVAFDAAVLDLWPTLTAGASVHLPDEAIRTSPVALRDWVVAERLTKFFVTTVLAEAMIRLDWPPGTALRILETGGERLSSPPPPGLPFGLLNVYGPTECSLITTTSLVSPTLPPGPPVIGRQVDGAAVRLLDRSFRLVPLGLPGEVCIAGKGLGRGYRARPEQTASSYVPDPFGGPGERMYRTGDLARFRTSGELEFVGRVDDQVKVRGHRIEPGEIEAVLKGHPAVREAVVLAVGTGADRRLVAAVVVRAAAANVSGLPAELRERLRAALPETMVPAAFALTTTLPLTQNGKVDRRALSRLAAAAAPEESLEAPRTPVEETLAAVWSDLLPDAGGIGRDSDFFALGGHSLLATRLAARVERVFAVDLPLADVFTEPTLAGLAARIEELRGEGGPAAPPLLPRLPTLLSVAPPAAFAQERFWFLDRLDPGSALYNVPAALRLGGPLDVAALAWALGEVVRRHEALRTTFATVENRPVQVIHPEPAHAGVEIPVADLRFLSGDRRERELGQLVFAEAQRPFDLARGPLLRARVVRLAERDSALLVTLHHIISDGWSIAILVRELGALYRQAQGGGLSPTALPPLPVQYADFAVWQREWLKGELLSAEIAWWRERLAGLPPELPLPFDHPRPPAARHRGLSLGHPLAGLLAPSAALARREGATLFMLLLAAFQVLLARFCGETDVPVGMPIANRARAGTEGLIGLFVNTLVLRGDLTGEPGFTAFLGRVREGALAAYAHQDLPFDKLVEALAPERSAARGPLFQVMFVLQEPPLAGLDLGGLALARLPIDEGVARFDLSLELTAETADLSAVLELDRDLFDAATGERLLAGFRTLLAGLLADPERRVSELPLLSPAERRHVLLAWNQTARPREAACLHELVEAQVDRTPDAVALAAIGDMGGALTFAELDRRANRLARRLRKLGVGTDGRVGLAAERSFELIVGMLAVLKAGAAFVPLDPDQPEERLAWVLAEVRPPVVLVQGASGAHLLQRLAAGPAGTPVLALETVLWEESAERPPATALPASLTYVIYTSGSTGRPKGVMIAHAGIVNHACFFREHYPLGATPATDTLLQITPFSFDAAIWEIFSPLASGARLVVAPPLAHQDPAYLTRTVAAEGVTVLQLVPSMLGPFLDDPGVAGCVSLRRLISGGEPLPGPLADRFLARLGADLVNFYGPTECSIDATRWNCRPGEPRSIVPIGLPLDNVRVHVLDAEMEPLPPGAPGELFVGGAGLARGYLGRPDLTAERFLPDPWPAPGAAPGERLYRTGDRVRRRPGGAGSVGGEIEYLGRLDQQVKVRGMRIELGEIEAVLATAPGVREGAVAAVGEGEARRLVAVVVLGGVGESGAIDTPALRRHCQRYLPAYMVPSAFVAVPRLPLLPSGKLDRRALADLGPLGGSNTEPEERFVAPASPLEEILAGTWAEVLGRERVSVEDDFFTVLGGHSLLATQVVARVRERLGLDVPLRSLFETPTVRSWAATVEAEGAGPSDLHLGPLRRVRRSELPLSFAQERLWFLDQLTPGLIAYNMPLSVDLDGRLDRAALERALAALVARHEVLRTAYRGVGGRLVQVVIPSAAADVALPVVDLRGLPATESERLAAEEARRPFDLSRAPLVRGRLLQLGDDEHRLLLTLHHIACDGWSLGVLVDEVGALYAGEALPELPLQYADYAAWQREELQGETLARQLEYWRRQLADLSALDLPTDLPRPAAESYRGGWVDIEIPGELADRLRQESREAGVTLFMLLLAGFQAVLARTSGQDDVAVGTAVANRRHRELEGLIGFFVNTLVLRTDLGGEPGWRDLLPRVREVALGAYAHQDLPFEKLVAELHPARDVSRAPLVAVTFVLQNTPLPELRLPGLAARSAATYNRTAKFDLSVSLEERSGGRGGLSGTLEYAADLFEPATVARLGRHFLRLLEAAVASPERPVVELPLLDEAERRQLVIEWNRTTVDRDPTLLVHQLFAGQAERTPEAVAVIAEGLCLSYGELDRRSSRLAWRLQELGVGPERFVGVSLARSADLVIALLGVLRAGGAYVPLDPELPAARRRAMGEDAGLSAVVTAAGSEPGRLAGSAVESGVTAANAVYAIYTSGSTGEPKGVVNTHGGVVNRLLWMQEAYGLSGEDRVLQKTPFSFDVSVWEFFWPLAVGAALVLARPGGERDPGYLAERIAAEGVTVLHFVPSMLDAFLAAQGVARCPGLRQVFASGEALSDALRRRFFAQSRTELHNLYGPTEAAVDVTAWRCAAEGAPRAVPIGRPIANTRIYVLDETMEPAPVGVPGELHIGGIGLARGYLNRAGQTAERFVPDPFADGERLYRTGDRARWRADGELLYLGRLDQQVKLRGFRVEPGEIEAVLAASPEVRQAVVVLREMAPGGPRLVAYVVPAAGAAPSAAALRQLCRERLPAYMVPAAFVDLPVLPLLPNGKLDRRALPAPPAQPAPSTGFVAPEGPFEEIVADLWAEVLGVERVSVADDFFADLGGHSLLATQVVARLRERLGLDLPLRSLFEAPTARRWAVLAASSRAPETGSLPLAHRGPDGGPPPLSYAQERLWFLDRMTPGLAAYNLPLAVRLTGGLDRAALARAWAAVVARHEALRTTFRVEGGLPIQWVAAPAEMPAFLPLLDLRRAGLKGESERLLAGESRRPFDLRRGPLFRARLLALADEEHLLLLTLHHLVADGWSFGVLSGELSALYAGELLPPLSLQYADYAVWQREWLAGEALAEQMAYWRHQLEGVPPLQLPADRPRPAVQSHRGGEVWTALSGALAQALRRLCRNEGVTLFMALLAGFEALLSRTSGQEDFAVGTAIANRGRPELFGLIGFFVNTLALRSDVGADPSVRQLLARVRARSLGAYAHQDLPFGKLVEELRPARDTSQSPLVQVMLVLQNTPLPALALGDLQTSLIAAPGESAIFDLTLEMRDVDGQIECRFEHDADLFEPVTVARLAGHYGRLLEAATADPERRVAGLPMLAEPERQQVLFEWNATAAPRQPAATVHALFEARAARAPEALAVLHGERRLTYSALNSQADALARRLAARGVGPETRVGLCCERSIEMLVAMLGILKAGGAYVPLDPEHPVERLAFLLADAGIAFVVTTDRLAPRLAPAPRGVTVLTVSPDEADEPHDPHEARGLASGAFDSAALAYVIYTSGSTGTPKGVAVSHANAVAFLSWCLATFPPALFAGTLASTSVTFDVSVFEIFGTWAQGGTIILAENLLDEAALAAADPPVTLIAAVPSVLEKLFGSRRLPDTVEMVALAGEAVPRSLVAALHERHPATAIRNLYGPTEATTYCTLAALNPTAFWPPIGRPIANAATYVLDGTLAPAAVGVPGELYIGGAGVARGYLGRPALTAERFLPDPWGPPGSRMYRSGDRVRWRADGELLYLGRSDQQVKLRGFRIEPGEVEAALKSNPSVAEAAVMARADAPGDRRLVAYVVLASQALENGAHDLQDLRRHCRERLPAYLVPSVFVVLDRLPLLPNGKLDRAALPTPEAARPDLGEHFVAPRSELEQTVAQAWGEVLGIERVGSRDNFFDLGGHSLLLVALHEKLEARLGRTLAIVDLFQHPTVESFALFLAQPTLVRALPVAALSERAAQRESALLARKPFRPDRRKT